MKKTHLAAAAAILLAAQLGALPSSRADAPGGRYTFPTTSTVLDTKTGLVWQRKVAATATSQATGASTCFNNPMALAGTGWRLPTAKELLTLLDFSRSNGLDSAAFPAEPSGAYWSATKANAAGDLAWIVNFPPSNSTNESAQASEAHLVRCVR
jgi:hypothetical protein